MPSEQDCAERLREQAYRTLLPQIKDLERELEGLSHSLSSGMSQIGRKLEALSSIELPTTEVVLREFLEEVVRQKDLEALSLVDFAREIRLKETQEEILGLLLDGANRHFPRVALFAVRGDRFAGWSSRGYSEALALNIASCSFLRSDCPQFEESLASEGQATADFSAEANPLSFLRQESQGPMRLLPLNVLQRPVALLLAEGDETAGRSNALSILADFAMLRLENIALKILYELTAAKPQTAAPEAAAEEAVEPEPAIAVPPPDVEPEPAAVPRFMTAEESAPAGIEAAPIAAVETTVPSVSQPDAVSSQAQETQTAEGEKSHADAKRFARLLVSEIKLYNEHHVLEGRRNQDLYLRLKRDIDRSREMYERRVSPSVSRKIDYFHDEIIRILGDNDPSTLGSDYPGPRVES
jgi:hypothetical protein